MSDWNTDELKNTNAVDLAVKVCLAARDHGLLTRPIRNVIVLMPPLCIGAEELPRSIEAIRMSILEVSRHGEEVAT
jgi:adenosylmethionine-8-amino-7-oxononanoate aminotransferase